MRKYPGIAIIAAFLATLVLLLFVIFFSINNNRQYLAISRELQEVNLMMQDLDGVYKQSSNILAAYRGYGIQGDKIYFDEFQKHSKSPSAESLKKFGLRNPSFSIEIDSLLMLNDNLITYCRQVFDAEEELRSASFASAQESTLKNHINRVIDRLENRGRAKLRFLENEQQHLAQNATRINYLLAFFCFLVLTGIFIMLNRAFNRKRDD